MTKVKSSSFRFFTTGLFVSLLSFAFLTVNSSQSLADPVEGGIAGAVGGAILGGIIDGGKGAARGAAIGGTIGVIGGALDESARAREYEDRDYDPYPGPRRRPVSAARSELVHSIQQSLTRLGYEPGPVDGVYGHKTSQAISMYQDENDLLVTGQPSRALLSHLEKNGG